VGKQPKEKTMNDNAESNAIDEMIDWLTDLGLSEEQVAEVRNEMESYNEDFQAGYYRFIHDSAINEILADELESDLYVLGCFTSWFIADYLDIPTDAVEAIQKAEQFEALGQLIKAKGVADFAESYATHDGYGPHFASYDGEEHNHGEWYAFKVG
jgi:hypothetical protein